MTLTRIAIPKRSTDEVVLDRPLTVRLTLQQRRTADLMASMSGYTNTSHFIRDLLTNAAGQMELARAA